MPLVNGQVGPGSGQHRRQAEPRSARAQAIEPFGVVPESNGSDGTGGTGQDSVDQGQMMKVPPGRARRPQRHKDAKEGREPRAAAIKDARRRGEKGFIPHTGAAWWRGSGSARATVRSSRQGPSCRQTRSPEQADRDRRARGALQPPRISTRGPQIRRKHRWSHSHRQPGSLGPRPIAELSSNSAAASDRETTLP